MSDGHERGLRNRRSESAVRDQEVDQGVRKLINKATWALCLTWVTGVTGTHAAQEVFCAQYAKEAIAQFEKGKAAGCQNLNPPVWSTNYEHHAGWCQRVSREQAEVGTKARQRALGACLASAKEPAPGGGSVGRDTERTRQCREYAQLAVQQNEENVNKGCGFRGAVWSSDYGHHYHWCARGENVRRAAGETNRRKEALQQCIALGSGDHGMPGGRPGPQTGPAGPSTADDMACAVYAREAANANKANLSQGCNFAGPEWNTDYQYHFRWCMHGENSKYRDSETHRRRERLATCEGGERAQKCAYYANGAVIDQKNNLSLNCKLSGREWNESYQYHFDWCMREENVRDVVRETKRRKDAMQPCIALRAGGCDVVKATESELKSYANKNSSGLTMKVVNVKSGNLRYCRFVGFRETQDKKKISAKLYMGLAQFDSDRVVQPFIIQGQVCDIVSDYADTGPWGVPVATVRCHVGTDDSYQGCGIAAAQNVLAYFGVEMSQFELRQYITATNYYGNIATTPGELEEGLQIILDRQGIDIDVIRHQVFPMNVHEFVMHYLGEGFPVVALVNNGTHWVVVYGYDNGTYHVHSNHRADTYSNIDLSMDGFVKFFADLFGDTYKDGTFISFRRRW